MNALFAHQANRSANKLLEEIARLTEKALPAAATKPSPADATADAISPPLNIAELLEQCSGNAAVAARVLQELGEQADHALAELASESVRHDAQRIARLGHSLKGAAAMAGAHPLQLAASTLEELGRSLDLAALDGAVAQLAAETARWRTFVKQTQHVAPAEASMDARR